MTFGERLTEALAERDWKPVQLAAAMAERGVDVFPTNVDRWMAGTVTPRLETARAIADALGMTLDELVPPVCVEPVE